MRLQATPETIGHARHSALACCKGGSSTSVPAVDTGAASQLEAMYRKQFSAMQLAMEEIQKRQAAFESTSQTPTLPSLTVNVPTYTAPTVPEATAPATLFSQGVAQAGLGVRRQAARRKGFLNSVFAGETGGFLG